MRQVKSAHLINGLPALSVAVRGATRQTVGGSGREGAENSSLELPVSSSLGCKFILLAASPQNEGRDFILVDTRQIQAEEGRT